MLHTTIYNYLSESSDISLFFKRLIENRDEIVLAHNEIMCRPSILEYIDNNIEILKTENSIITVIINDDSQKLPILYRTDFNTKDYKKKNKIISTYPKKYLHNYFIKHILTNETINYNTRVNIVYYCLYYYNFIHKEYTDHKHLITKIKYELSDIIIELSKNQFTTYRDCDPDSVMLSLFQNKLEDEILNIEL